jgi:hemerythrin
MAVLFEWTDELSVNIPVIDEQHKKLISHINEFYAHMKTGKAKQVMNETLNKLIDYVGYHFSTEEDFFNKFNYPDKDAHVREHKAFVEKVKIVSEDFKNGKLAVTIELFTFLTDWVENHIKQIDKRYEPFLKGKINK